jgi:hypothetical protein
MLLCYFLPRASESTSTSRRFGAELLPIVYIGYFRVKAETYALLAELESPSAIHLNI